MCHKHAGVCSFHLSALLSLSRGRGTGRRVLFHFLSDESKKKKWNKDETKKKINLKKLNVAFVACGRALNCIKEFFARTSRRRSAHKAKCIVWHILWWIQIQMSIDSQILWTGKCWQVFMVGGNHSKLCDVYHT